MSNVSKKKKKKKKMSTKHKENCWQDLSKTLQFCKSHWGKGEGEGEGEVRKTHKFQLGAILLLSATGILASILAFNNQATNTTKRQ